MLNPKGSKRARDIDNSLLSAPVNKWEVDLRHERGCGDVGPEDVSPTRDVHSERGVYLLVLFVLSWSVKPTCEGYGGDIRRQRC